MVVTQMYNTWEDRFLDNPKPVYYNETMDFSKEPLEQQPYNNAKLNESICKPQQNICSEAREHGEITNDKTTLIISPKQPCLEQTREIKRENGIIKKQRSNFSVAKIL